MQKTPENVLTFIPASDYEIFLYFKNLSQIKMLIFKLLYETSILYFLRK